MKRTFIAIKIHPQKSLISFINRLKTKLYNGKINWINYENFHITLKFIGETGDAKIIEIDSELKKICNCNYAFDINLQGVGVFGSRYQPKVIWCGINKSDAMTNLAIRIHNAMEIIGFPKDRQNFVPHLTLARIKSINNKIILLNEIEEFKNTFFQKVVVNEFILFESILKETGAKYREINNYKFL